jgi:hypothetical protein
MIKELFLAIVLGALMGFGVTGGYFAMSKNKNTSAAASKISPVITTAVTEISSAPTPTVFLTPVSKNENPDLTINSPDNYSIVSTSKISIKGTTFANSTVIVSTLNKNIIVSADKNGIFSATVELDSGLNQIHITAVNDNDDQTESTLNITYSTAKI